MLMGVVVLLLAPQAMAGMLIGSTLDAIYDIDQTTGVASNPRSLGSRALAIEFADGILYGAAGRDVSAIDVATGATHALGTITGLDRYESIYDLSWNPQTKTLYALAHLGGWRIDRLYTIDTVTLGAELVGQLEGSYQTIAFDASGALFAISRNPDVVSLIDTATARTLSSTTLSADIQSAAMVFANRDQLIASMAIGLEPGFVFDVNPNSGTLSDIGRTGLGVGFSSLAYIPEPGSLVLLLVGLGGTGARRMRIMVNCLDQSGNWWYRVL